MDRFTNHCRYCGIAMANPRRVQCGEPECFRQWRNDRQRSYLADHLERYGVRYEDRYKVSQHCIDCGSEFRARPSHKSKRCRPCGTAYGRTFGVAASAIARAEMAAAAFAARSQLVLVGQRRTADTLAYRLAAERLARAEIGSRPRARIWVDATCRRCNERFICMWTNDLPVYCSRRCSHGASKVRRRARAVGGTPVAYVRVEIFQRDSWTCRLCGKRVKRTARVPDPKAPVIDHIVPLAAGAENGGVDAPWNVQCAHFLCNSIKSANYTSPALF
jgi:hypothetical protein